MRAHGAKHQTGSDPSRRRCTDFLSSSSVICQLEALSGLDTTLVRKCPRPGVTTASPAANDTATVPPTNGSSTRGIAYSTAAPQQADTTATPGNGIGMVIQNRRRKREAGHRTDNSLPEEEEEQGGGCQPGTGYYGIFQLSDRIFCDSGENPTRNLCRTRCSGECATGTEGSGPPWWMWAGLTQASCVSAAFADDDISDDISCILRTGYWR